MQEGEQLSSHEGGRLGEGQRDEAAKRGQWTQHQAEEQPAETDQTGAQTCASALDQDQRRRTWFGLGLGLGLG